MTDSTPGAVAIMRFQAAVAAKDVKTFTALLSDQCVLVVLTENNIYIGKEAVMKVYQEEWFGVGSSMGEFSVSLTNDNGYYEYNLKGNFLVNGYSGERESKMSFVVEKGLIVGIVRESKLMGL